MNCPQAFVLKLTFNGASSHSIVRLWLQVSESWIRATICSKCPEYGTSAEKQSVVLQDSTLTSNFWPIVVIPEGISQWAVTAGNPKCGPSMSKSKVREVVMPKRITSEQLFGSVAFLATSNCKKWKNLDKSIFD